MVAIQLRVVVRTQKDGLHGLVRFSKKSPIEAEMYQFSSREADPTSTPKLEH